MKIFNKKTDEEKETTDEEKKSTIKKESKASEKIKKIIDLRQIRNKLEEQEIDKRVKIEELIGTLQEELSAIKKNIKDTKMKLRVLER